MSSQAAPSKPTVQDLVDRNKSVAQNHTSVLQIKDFPPEAKPTILIVACADPRCEPAYIFALKQGEAMVLRNVGGRITSVLPDVCLVDSLFTFKEMVIVHHIDCGASVRPKAVVREQLESRFPHLGSEEVEELLTPLIFDFGQSIRDDMKTLKDCKFVRKELADSTFGFVFDGETGLLAPVL